MARKLLERIVFALVLALGGTVLAIALSGPGLFLGWLFGAVSILTFAALMAFGAVQRGSLRGVGPWLAVGVAAHLGVWTWLVLTYRGFETAESHPLYLAFPAPTAIMLYALLPVPIVFVLVFVLGFKRWVLSDEDLDAYERLLEAESRDGQGDAP